MQLTLVHKNHYLQAEVANVFKGDREFIVKVHVKLKTLSSSVG